MNAVFSPGFFEGIVGRGGGGGGLLEMSCKICQDHARLTRTNVQKSYKNILARS